MMHSDPQLHQLSKFKIFEKARWQTATMLKPLNGHNSATV